MITVRQLAEMAGVSPSTVSKALNDSSDISEETKAQIQALAKREGYQKEARKRPADKTLKDGPIIGLIYSDIKSRYYSKLLDTFNNKVRKMGGVVLACDSQFSTERAIQLCQFLDKECHVDGLISISAGSELVMDLHTNAPMVVVLRAQAQGLLLNAAQNVDFIALEARYGLTQAVNRLLELGHTEIAFLSEEHSKARQRIFQQIMDDKGLQVAPALLPTTKLRYEEAGYETMTQVFRAGLRPTAVMCGYDDMAVGASKAIFEAGLRIPEDISLVGYDNSQLRLLNQRVLASVTSFIDDQVAIMLDMLMKRIEDNTEGAVRSVSLQTAFLPYETVGPAPQG